MANLDNVLSIDVECVANGLGHNDRAPCLVAIVDGHGRVLLRRSIIVEGGITSYLTPVTGIKEGDLVDAHPFDVVLAEVHAYFSPETILVGQGIASDIKWMHLEEGTHFQKAVDLAEHFKAWHPRYNRFNHFSLNHTATTLLDHAVTAAHEAHDPADDALWSIMLYREYVLQPKKLDAARNKLLRTRAQPSVAKLLDYQCDGVCMAKFYKAKCICGQE
eukprot:m.8144 g.8144  ORF g.8144 m.8144 type:complete len:218 (-) comp5323_c0_seq1:217-870(-)